MNDKNKIERVLKKINKNMPLDNQYTIAEIKEIFKLLKTYESCTNREKDLYNIFFTEFANDNDIKLLSTLDDITTTKLKKLYQSYTDEQKIEFGKFWFKRFRLKKIRINDTINNVKIKITPRSDEKYSELDKFQIYELTPCIAYEMAIRNQDVKDLLKKYDKISSLMLEDKYLDKRHTTQHNYILDKEYPLRKYITNHNSKEYYKLIKKEVILDPKYEKDRNQVVKEISNYHYLIKTDYKNFIDNHIDTYTELSIFEISILKDKLEEELINGYLIYPTGYERKFTGAKSIYTEEILNAKKPKKSTIIDNKHSFAKEEGYNFRSEEIVYDEFTKLQSAYISSNKYSINNIVPNFHRQVNDQNQITMPINLSLPLEEIKEYIKIVKEKIDIKSPIELLGEELNQANDLTNMIISKKDKNIHLNATKGKYPQYALADMIYIYDMTNKGYSQQDILYSISEYYEILNNDKGLALKLTLRDERTITKYFEIAKDYIENARYKELITGKTSLK